MIRKSRALALVLVAAFAFCAVAASAAMAEEGTLTSDGPVSITGTDAAETETTFRGFGMEVKCKIKYTIGNLKETPHKFVTPPVARVTVKPDTIKCKGKSGGTELPVTVASNKCDFTRVFPLLKPPKWKMKENIECEGGMESVEFHFYANPTHTLLICTVKVPPQENLEGGTAENISGGKITFGGTFTGISASKSGACGVASTSSAEEEADVEVSGENEAGGSTAIELS